MTGRAPVYKILTAPQWAAYSAGGDPAVPVDVADGFVHLSTADQVRETAARHFAGEEGLWLLAFDPASLGPALRWEASRGGALFPHLYAPLPDGASGVPLPLGPAGHVFPAEIP